METLDLTYEPTSTTTESTELEFDELCTGEVAVIDADEILLTGWGTVTVVHTGPNSARVLSGKTDLKIIRAGIGVNLAFRCDSYNPPRALDKSMTVHLREGDSFSITWIPG